MRIHPIPLLLLLALLSAADPVVRILPDAPDGKYRAGATITWTISAEQDGAPMSGTFDWLVQSQGAVKVNEGKLELGAGNAVTVTAKEPAWLLFSVNIPKGGKNNYYYGGALVDGEKIRGVTPEAGDFDAFWKAQLALLAAVPMDAKVEPGDSGDAAIEYGKVSLANINGTRVNGQYAKPKGEGKFPGAVIYQYAGVYPLQKAWVTGFAKRGYLALNIIAHDLPIDEPAEFYKAQNDGPLKDYMKIGVTNRDTTYVRRMFLGTRRAIDWILARPDLDKRTLLVTGTSQGGFQSFAAAGLSPEVTHLAVNVPAGSDLAAGNFGRRNGWPGWGGGAPEWQAWVNETAGYYDPTAFAARTKAKALVAVGLIDTTSPACHVLSSFNALKGPKELVSMPESPHTARRGEQKAWSDGSSKFFDSAKP